MSPTPDPYMLEPLPAIREFPQPEMIERARAFHGDIAAVYWSTTGGAESVAGAYAIGDLNPGDRQQGL